MSAPVVVLLVSLGFVTFLLRFLYALSRERHRRPIYRAAIWPSIAVHSKTQPEVPFKRTQITGRERTRLMPVSASPQTVSYRLRVPL